MEIKVVDNIKKTESKLVNFLENIDELDETELFLSSLYYEKAFTEKFAIPKKTWVNDKIFVRLSKRGYIKINADKVYLTSLGLRSALLIIRDNFIHNVDKKVVSKSTDK